MENTQICKECKIEKEKTSFPYSNVYKSSVRKICKQCVNISIRKKPFLKFSEEDIWKDIPEYEGRYQASTIGNIRSVSRFREGGRDGGLRYYEGNYIKQTVSPYGYSVLMLYSSKNKYNGYMAHRLIAQTFIPNPENKPQVNHINGIKTDNRVENLEWVTAKENIKHAYENELILVRNGEKSGNNKLTEKQVLDIRSSDKSQSKLAKEYNVDSTTIGAIINRKNWKHI